MPATRSRKLYQKLVISRLHVCRSLLWTVVKVGMQWCRSSSLHYEIGRDHTTTPGQLYCEPVVVITEGYWRIPKDAEGYRKRVRSKTQKTAKDAESRRKTPKDGGLRSNFEKFKQISQQNTYLSRKLHYCW